MGLIRLGKYSNKMLYPSGMLILDVFVILSLLVMKELISDNSYRKERKEFVIVYNVNLYYNRCKNKLGGQKDEKI